MSEIRTALPTFALSLHPNVSNLTFTGTGAFVGTGNALGNVITGGPGNDILLGYAGNDTLIGAAGVDVLHGDEGIDSADYSASDSPIAVDLTRRIASGGHAQGDVLLSIEGVTGSDYADILSSATNGHILHGGDGDDTYRIGAYRVTILEAEGSGTDEIQTSVQQIRLNDYANVENLIYVGDAFKEFRGEGNGLNNVIIARSGNDELSGRGGNDTLRGGAGHDIISGGPGADIIDGGEGYDRAIFDSIAYVTVDLHSGALSTGEAKGDTFTGIEEFIGGLGADRFYADQTSTAFFGSGDYDTLSYKYSSSSVTLTISATSYYISGYGKGGFAEGDSFFDMESFYGSTHDDIYIIDGNLGLVSIVEQENGGTDEIRTNSPRKSLDYFIENLTYTGSGNFVGIGNRHANVIIGGPGDDMLYGGHAADELVGGAGADTFSFDVLDGTSDVIGDFDASADRIALNRATFTAFSQSAAGAIPAGTFEIGSIATKPDSHLVYDDTTGDLFYDLDGLGAATQMRIASLPNAPSLSAESFVLT